jgi:ACS family glucarate transporter-like MFS transporter
MVLFTPLMAWITHDYGWHAMFFVMGGIGIVFGLIGIKTIKDPKDHPALNKAELDYISQGGALVGLDQTKSVITGPKWSDLKELLSNRMLVGIYVAQYCITTLTCGPLKKFYENT